MPHILSDSTVSPGPLPSLSSAWTGWGQWIALITMSLDHAIRYLLPETWELGWASSSIGRIAFPLFAAMVAWHALFDTRDAQRYARRILVIGLAAQLPYLVMPRGAFQLNVCFTLGLSLAWASGLRTLLGSEAARSNVRHAALGLGLLLLSPGLWLLLGPWLEYGHAGLALVPGFMLALSQLARLSTDPGERAIALAASLPVLALADWLNHSLMAKAFTLATVLGVLWLAAGGAQRVSAVALRMPRWLWLGWYPGHFAAIAAWLLFGAA
ncbi:TraX family protein [Halomonas sp. HP20-15]|uniref:TraX family protein n=1 Tax=Halomonas sp. HP20-15 TaxID=3085901 RepID=UPI0029819854|nr:TraX family protein [Halomonas sp. HP20-15]MDW5377792.1 TraX family protein [Halomonas sp. HP20-15]